MPLVRLATWPAYRHQNLRTTASAGPIDALLVKGQVPHRVHGGHQQRSVLLLAVATWSTAYHKV